MTIEQKRMHILTMLGVVVLGILLTVHYTYKWMHTRSIIDEPLPKTAEEIKTPPAILYWDCNDGVTMGMSEDGKKYYELVNNAKCVPHDPKG